MRRERVGAIVLALLGLSPIARAQNLVVNGEFPADVSGWSVGPMASFGWAMADWQGAPASGSGALTNVAPCAGVSVSRCVPLPLPLAASYEAGGAVELLSATVDGSAQFAVLASAGSGCEAPVTASFSVPIAAVTGQWVNALDQGIVLPPATRSVGILLTVTKPFLPGCVPLPNVSALFDHVRFGPTGTTPVRLQSLSIE
jgi:hypothetical protein